MAMRNADRKHAREEMVAYLHGIDPKGNVAHILVHKKGKNVRFSGELGAHNVAPANSADIDKWMREAELVWGLADVMGVARGWMHTPENIAKLDELTANASKKKKELEAAEPLETVAEETVAEL